MLKVNPAFAAAAAVAVATALVIPTVSQAAELELGNRLLR